MKYSELSQYEPVVLKCPCGRTYSGQKRDSHDWIAAHKTHVTETGTKMSLLHVGKAAIAYERKLNGPDEDRKVSRIETDLDYQQQEWRDLRAAREM